VLVSKPPSPAVARRVLDLVRESAKPTVVCFLGGDLAPIVAAGAIPARTLQEAAYLAASRLGGEPAQEAIERETVDLRAQAFELRKRLHEEQRYLRGLYSGGTLAAEALVIWQDILGDVRSNVALDPRLKMRDASEGHCAVDLGEDEFTVGRPHPMIDNELRIRRLMQEARDPEVAVIVLDVVLGYGAHPDPAGELGPAIQKARALRQGILRGASEGVGAASDAQGAEGELIVIVSVTGTEEDPQGLGRQVEALERSGAVVAPCNAAAARLAGYVVAQEAQP